MGMGSGAGETGQEGMETGASVRLLLLSAVTRRESSLAQKASAFPGEPPPLPSVGESAPEGPAHSAERRRGARWPREKSGKGAQGAAELPDTEGTSRESEERPGEGALGAGPRAGEGTPRKPLGPAALSDSQTTRLRHRRHRGKFLTQTFKKKQFALRLGAPGAACLWKGCRCSGGAATRFRSASSTPQTPASPALRRAGHASALKSTPG